MASQKERIYGIIEQLNTEQLDSLQQLLADWLEKGEETALAEVSPAYRVAEHVEPAERKAAELTVGELENLVYFAVLDALRDSSPIDPDAGLELREEFIEELERARKEVEAGEVYTLEEVAKELGLDL